MYSYRIFWGKTFLAASYVIIHMPPHHVLQLKDLPEFSVRHFPQHITSHLTSLPKRFVYAYLMHVQNHQRCKFDPRTIKDIVLGCSPTKKCYKCCNATIKNIYLECHLYIKSGLLSKYFTFFYR